jgi:hypothetical protein
MNVLKIPFLLHTLSLYFTRSTNVVVLVPGAYPRELLVPLQVCLERCIIAFLQLSTHHLPGPNGVTKFQSLTSLNALREVANSRQVPEVDKFEQEAMEALNELSGRLDDVEEDSKSLGQRGQGQFQEVSP